MVNSNFYTAVESIGNFIHLREIKDGTPSYRKIKYKPTFFVPVEKKTKHQTLFDQYLQPIEFEDIRAARDWQKQYEGIKNFEFYGMSRYQYQYISDNYKGVINYNFDQLNIAELDIETESTIAGKPDAISAPERINLITVKRRGKYYAFGLGPFKHDRKDVVYTECETERELISKYLDFWSADYPDIITGWSIRTFDIPYIVNRIRKLFDPGFENRLSPFGKIKPDVYRFQMQEFPTYAFPGIAILDYLQLYKKFIPHPRENYKLGYIAQVELGITKLDHAEYARFSDFYKNDWQKYVEYNIRDVELIGQLESKLSLIAMVVESAYYCKCNYEDVLSQVRSWDCKVYNFLRDQNIQIPQMKFYDKDFKFEGAFIKDPLPGMYEWIVGEDVNSLYPNIARFLNIGAETKIDKVRIKVNDFLENSSVFQENIKESKINGWSLAANGVRYSKKQESFYAALIRILFNERKECQKLLKAAKKIVAECEKAGDKSSEVYLKAKDTAKKMHILQYAKKIALNSLYGCMGTIYWRFFDVDNAEAITLTGQVIIQHISRRLNEFLNRLLKTESVDYVIMNDTDSAVLTLKTFVEKSGLTDKQKIVDLIDRFEKEKLSKVIEKAADELANDYFNGYLEILKMSRGEIADKSIHTAKKRYVMNVLDEEGIRKLVPELKCTGIEIKKATNPKFCRDNMEQAVKIIMASDNDSLIKFLDKTKKEFELLKTEDISMPRGCNGLEDYYDSVSLYKKGCPMAVRGALLFNKRIDDLKLGQKYAKIQKGDKVRYMFLKTPNPIRENIISFPDKLPVDFGLHGYIDYDMQWQKSFLEPLNIILKAIKWQSEKKGNLSKFFGAK